ncbi:MAG: GNAT family N-acetyltransferase [Vibrio sp.]
MVIQELTKQQSLDLVPIFSEMENYYFGANAATKEEIATYLLNGVFSDYSGVHVVAYYDESEVVGFTTFSILFPAPNLSGQLFMKDLFVSADARGKKVGQQLMRYLAQLAIEHGVHRFDWTAESTNPKAGQFYHAIGAQQIQEKQYYRFEGDELRRFAEHQP